MDALDVRVRDAAEVEELTNLPVIACIPADAGKEQ
jgi:capsular polysaccharide biosynthesis protein